MADPTAEGQLPRASAQAQETKNQWAGGPPAGLLPHHWAELQASAIAPDVAALNVASFGPGTDRHWEAERAALIAHARREIETESRTASGLPQWQPGFLADRLIRLQQRYRHLQSGGWRSRSEALPGLPVFDQWKPDAPRLRIDKPGRSIKYEAPPAFPDGGGLLLPRVPERCWRLICERQGLPFPDAATVDGGFWAWAAATPSLRLLICEGWKKALAAVSVGWAAVALPGVQMGRRRGTDGSEWLIQGLQILAADRPWLIAFDAERSETTARKVGAAAGALARALRSAGGRVEIARLPLLPKAAKTGLDDLLAAAGPEALDRALAETGPRPVLPWLRVADQTAPAGAFLATACPLPSPDVAPLVVVRGPMGTGKTEAVSDAVAPLQADGVPILMPSHRQALGQAAAERVGVPWCPTPGSDERLQGMAGCLDSWCPDSSLQISGDGWSGGVLVLDEWMQALDHLLFSNGTALGQSRRAEVLRTLAETIARSRQVIALDAQMAEPAVVLLEALTGRRAHLIGSDHRPMAGRPLHCPEGFRTPQAAADAFRVKWAELVAAGRSFLCWTTAQKAGSKNAPQTLAKLHRQRVPGARVLVIDSTTPEVAARLAADPDGEAARWDAIYCSPSISSGISFRAWRPAAVIALAGGTVAPEHPAQALARVRCPEVPAWLFAPEIGAAHALRVGNGATDPEALLADLRAVTDPLLGVLEAAGTDGAWLRYWAERGAQRNRQQFAYRATIAGLLEAEGWQLQAPGPAPCPAVAAEVSAELTAITEVAVATADAALIAAPLISSVEAAALARRRQLAEADRVALDRFRLAERWGLGAAAPSLALLEAERQGLRERLRLGWLLTTPEAVALVPAHDRQQIAALDPAGRPFAPDRLRVALAQKVAALQALGLPQLMARFATGETIAATDPAVLALHAAAVTHRRQLVTAAGISPAVLPTGTLRRLLSACGWRLQRAGRVKTRGAERDALTYRAERLALPEGADPAALAAVWLAELRDPLLRSAGALSRPTENPYRGEKCPTPRPSPPPPLLNRWPLAPAVAIPWDSAPAPTRSRPLATSPQSKASLAGLLSRHI